MSFSVEYIDLVAMLLALLSDKDLFRITLDQECDSQRWRFVGKQDHWTLTRDQAGGMNTALSITLNGRKYFYQTPLSSLRNEFSLCGPAKQV